MLFNCFSSISNYNEYFKDYHFSNKIIDGVYVNFYNRQIFEAPSAFKFVINREVKCNSMALKKKKNISDRVVEFVLKSSLDDFQDLTVTKIASTFHVNRCYLSRKFKSDKAFTLCEFLIREKLSRSIVLLRENDQITIQELSAKMGFSNTNYFIQIFRNYFGAPPGRYREYISKGNTSLSPKRA